jgi:hypothetical protein
MVAVSILAVVFVGLSLVASSARGAFRTGSAGMDSESEGSRTMRRILDALRTTDFDSISAVPSLPFSAPSIDFQQCLGYQDKQTEYSAVRRISVEDGSVALRESPGVAGDYASTWCGGVAALGEGELFNGVDDNGNGLIDETGLCFSRQGLLLSVSLTLESEGADGQPVARTWTSSLLCRNP